MNAKAPAPVEPVPEVVPSPQGVTPPRSLRSVLLVLLALALTGSGGFYLYSLSAGTATIQTRLTTPASSSLDDGLVGHWTFDGPDLLLSSSTAEVRDVSGNNNHGNWQNHATTTTAGVLGQALRFDGANDYVQIADASTLRPGDGSWTISLCANPPNTSIAKTLIGKRQNSGGFDNYSLSINDGNCHAPGNGKKLSMSYIENGGNIERCRYTTNNVADGKWHHLAGVADKDANTLYLYVDGVQQPTSASFNGGSWPNITNTDYLSFAYQNGGSNYFAGSIDDVRIYNRALSATEVQRLYRMGEGTKINVTATSSRPGYTLNDGLVGHWTFDGPDLLLSSSTAEVRDVSGNGNHGNWENHATTTAAGRVGQGLRLDGTNDYIEIGNSLKVDNSSQGTIAAWIFSGATLDGSIVGYGGAAQAGTGDRIYLGVSSGYLTFVFVDETNGTNSLFGPLLARNSWHYIAIVSSGSQYSMFVNGEPVSFTGTDNGMWFDDVTVEEPDVSSIGRLRADGTFLLPFSGSLDDVRIYNRVLSATEIQGLYTLGQGSKVGRCGAGNVRDADNNFYNIIEIGTQCWLDRNMNVGTRVNVSSSQTNNATVEKWCYSDSDANCTSGNPKQGDGGLYTWDEAMQYVTTEGTQGICPSGWHIPTDAEWYTLENYLKDNSQTCDAGRSGTSDCAPAGTKLKPGGSSQFQGNLAGLGSSGSFSYRLSYGIFWSSSQTGANARFRSLYSGESSVNRGVDSKATGYSIRCVKDAT